MYFNTHINFSYLRCPALRHTLQEDFGLRIFSKLFSKEYWEQGGEKQKHFNYKGKLEPHKRINVLRTAAVLNAHQSIPCPRLAVPPGETSRESRDYSWLLGIKFCHFLIQEKKSQICKHNSVREK